MATRTPAMRLLVFWYCRPATICPRIFVAIRVTRPPHGPCPILILSEQCSIGVYRINVFHLAGFADREQAP